MAISVLLVTCVILVGMAVGYHWSLSSKVKHHLDAVRAAHEPVTLVELNGYYPAVPAGSNAALVYGRAFELLQKSRSATFLEHLDELPPDSDPLPVDIREAMEKACQENAGALGVLGEATKLQFCRFPVDYAPGWAALLPHLRHLPKCSALEMCRGVLHEQQGDVQEAIQCINKILLFSASLDSEPDLISVLVQQKLSFHATELLRWLLNHRPLSQQQLEDLQELFHGAERTNRLDKALIGDRCIILAVFDSSPGEILNVIDPGYERRVRAVFGIRVLRVSGNLKKDELRFLERVDECREALRLPLLAGLDRAAELRLGMNREGLRKNFILTGVLLPPFLKGVEKNAQGIARQRLVQTALAVERYRVVQDRLPTSLADVSPRFLSQIPLDPFSTEEMHYREEGNGYVLYSVGPDRQDDGGTKPISRNPKAESPHGDIIFAVSR